jgi:HAD superfamily phosphoserine phosphatase-like hydrolase
MHPPCIPPENGYNAAMFFLTRLWQQYRTDRRLSRQAPSWRSRRAAAAGFRPPDLTRVRYVVFDLDGTLTSPGNSWLLIRRRYPAAYRESQRQFTRFLNGDIDVHRLYRDNVSLLKQYRVNRDYLFNLHRKMRPLPGTVRLLSYLRASGRDISIVSANFSTLIRPTAQRLGVADWHGNELFFDDGGTLRGVTVHVDMRNKADVLTRLAAERGVTASEVLYAGDSPFDVDAVMWAGCGVFLNNHNPEKHRADVVVDNMRQLYRLFARCDQRSEAC